MDKQTLLVTGAGGQLGRDLVLLFSESGYKVHGYARADLDITNMAQVASVFDSIQPDIVIHAAAYTKVDMAESAREEAFLILPFRLLIMKKDAYRWE